MVLALAIAAVAAIAIVVAVAIATSPARQPPPPRELLPSSPEYRNHQAMARWIEKRLHDDMVRPLLGEDDQAEARRLLGEFYGEDG